MLSLHRLRLLRELEARGTVGAVAATLDYTPSAVSQQLRVLEQEAGATLVERAGRGVRLTDAGRVLAEHAGRLLEAAEAAEGLDVAAFERASLERIGMPREIAMRHRTPHFAHVFSGDGYSAGYYSYLWSEVLDADGFKAFEETGDVFDAGTARRLRDFVYSAGDRRDPADAYLAFRGRAPKVDALLAKRGLA